LPVTVRSLTLLRLENRAGVCIAAMRLTACGASVLDADPRLARPLAAHGASSTGRAALLPVLAVDAGGWDPPERDALGAGTTGLIVLAGLLRHGALVLGPGDQVVPWSGGAWLACTPARLAVVGAAFAAALEPWPDVAELARRPRPRALRLPGPSGEVVEERLLALLWQLAARCGRPVPSGLALPAGLGAGGLARLLGEPEDGTRRALDGLRARRAVTLCDGAWLLRPAPDGEGPHARRDRLRARVAEQCATARALGEDAQVLAEGLDRARVSSARRRSP
jgi:hypothetical protein